MEKPRQYFRPGEWMIFANSWWVESKSLSANKPLIAGCFIPGKIRKLDFALC